MKIEILDFCENRTCKIFFKTIKIWHDGKKHPEIYINSDAFVGVCDLLSDEEGFYKEMRELRKSTQFNELLIFAFGVADYDLNDITNPFRNEEWDRIWKKLIALGVVKLKNEL